MCFQLEELGEESVDIISMVFVLSAIHPDKHNQVLRGKNISPNLINSYEPEPEPEPYVFGPSEPELLEKTRIGSRSRLRIGLELKEPEPVQKKQEPELQKICHSCTGS